MCVSDPDWPVSLALPQGPAAGGMEGWSDERRCCSEERRASRLSCRFESELRGELVRLATAGDAAPGLFPALFMADSLPSFVGVIGGAAPVAGVKSHLTPRLMGRLQRCIVVAAFAR